MESTPENCPKHADESMCTGVNTKAESNTVTTNGAICHIGVRANVLDSCVGVVSATVGSAVEGTMATDDTHPTECGHEEPD